MEAERTEFRASLQVASPGMWIRAAAVGKGVRHGQRLLKRLDDLRNQSKICNGGGLPQVEPTGFDRT